MRSPHSSPIEVEFYLGLQNAFSLRRDTGDENRGVRQVESAVIGHTSFYNKLAGTRCPPYELATNGADLVFTKANEIGEIIQVMAVEVKNTVGNVNLGTLGLNQLKTNYGGSIDRLISTALRFLHSSNPQLNTESNIIKDAYNGGYLTNTLVTTSNHVSKEVNKIFNEVITSFSSAQGAIKIFANNLSSFVSSSEIVPFFIILPNETIKDILNPPWQNQPSIQGADPNNMKRKWL